MTGALPRRRRFVVPDLDGEIATVSEPVVDVLYGLAAWADEDPTVELPPLVGWPAAEAASDVRSAISDATFHDLYAPDGDYQHLPLAVVELPDSTVARFVDVIDELIDVVRRDANEHVAAVVDEDAGGRDQFLDGARRLRDLCDHRWGDDEAVIAARLTTAPAGRVVLTADEEAAYRRIRDRLVATWHHHSGIDRWLY